MPGNFKQYDLRIIKTRKALLEALPRLLSKRSFGRITVNDICEESQMSRTAFYSHFNDKYDLLRYWLSERMPEIGSSYIEIEKTINTVIDNNRSIITNLIEDANSETVGLINDFVSSVLTGFIGGCDTKGTEPFDVVLYGFCTGGILNLVSWQIKNRFPVDLKMVNVHLYEILEALKRLENNRIGGGAK